ncbi:hypothetical protein AN958_04784 [Leucoagaricus sp. SymC.cos]|nr:hypothetical protein AN958_04784 [Leucoagaricus sp. SymC.cos]
MSPRRPSTSSSSESESDAPEAVSLSQSKKSIQKQNAEVWKAEQLAREKTKLKNRVKDQKLKERAVRNRKDEDGVGLKKEGKRKKVEMEDEDEDEDEDEQEMNDAEARMLRAMQDAEGEESEGEANSAEFQEGSSFGRIDMDDNDDLMEGGSGDSEEEVAEDDFDQEETPKESLSKPKKSPNYLPDELFKAAFSQASKPALSPSKKPTASKMEQKKRKRTSSAPKDVIVGSKAIRTLASTARPVSSRAAVPSAKVNKFLDRSLALKGQKPISGKGWERRPANIGVLRRTGPAAHFVRSR